jgi:predicted RND superfamily exporter protein
MKEKKLGNSMDRLYIFLARHRMAIMAVVLVVAVVFTYGAFKIKGKVILKDMLPHDHAFLKLQNRFAEVFGSGGSTIAIALRVKNGDVFNEAFLTKLRNMTNEVLTWDEVYRSLTVSLATRSVKVVKALKKGEINIEPIMWPDVPKTPEAIALLKKNVLSSPAYNGSLVSRDGTSALILTEMKENISYEQAFGLLEKLAKTYTDEMTEVHYIGYPVLMGWIYSFKQQIYLIFGISFILMMIMLFVIFRNIVGMVVPVATCFFFTLVGIGIMGFTGFNFSPLLYVLVFLVGAMMISHSVQCTNRYLEELHACNNDKIQASYLTMKSMVTPAFAAITTDTAGFLVLGIAKIALMRQLAIVMSIWMISIIFTSILTPIICSLMPLGHASDRWSKDRTKKDIVDRGILAVTRFSIGRGKWVVGVGTIVLFVICFWFMSGIKIGDPTPGSPLLWPNHKYNRDQALINKIFDASSENFLVYYEGERESVYDPEVLLTFEAFDRHMQEQLPDIYKSPDSLINTVKMVNVTLHDGDQIWYQLVRNSDLLTGLMGYVKSSTDPATLGRYIDRTLERAQLTLYFADHTSDNLLRIRDAAYGFFKTTPAKLSHGEFKLAGGRVGMEIALNEEMKHIHAATDGVIYGTILLLCIISYQSFVGGLMLTLPLILANAVAVALMVFQNIGLSINTLPVTAIGAGMGVDFAIYLYSRARDEYAVAKDWTKTILLSVSTTGKAVVYTGLTMLAALLPWYFLSGLKFQAQMGVFLAVVFGMNVILTLTLHPLLLSLIKPKFITRGGTAVDEEACKAEAETLGFDGTKGL